MTRAQIAPQTRPNGEMKLPARAPALASPRALAQKVVASTRLHRDTLTPLALALAVRVAVLAAGSALLRLVVDRIYPPPHAVSLIDAWNKKDALWYLAIAETGYNYSPVIQSRANFFPLYPGLIAFGEPVAQALGLPSPYALTGMAISWLAFGGACVALYRLTLAHFDRRVAAGAVLLLGVFPFSFYYGAVFTESLRLLLAVSIFLAIERRRWWVAGALAGLAGALHPSGLILGGCVWLAYGLDWWREGRRLRWDALALGLTPLGTLAYLLYSWVNFGDPMAYFKTSRAGWHGGLQLQGLRFTWHLVTNRHTWQILRHPHNWFIHGYYFSVTSDLFYLALALLWLILIPFVWRRLGPIYGIFLTIGVVTPFVEFSTLNSLGRYLSGLFPAFIMAAYLLRGHPRLLYVITGLSLVVLCVYAAFFAAGFGLS